jgi:hypothetical protein
MVEKLAPNGTHTYFAVGTFTIVVINKGNG